MAHARVTFITFLTLLLLFLVWNIWMVAPYLLAVLMGGVLALLTQPLYRRLLDRGLGPKTAAGVLTTLVIIIFVGPVSLFTSRAIAQGITLARALADHPGFSVDSVLQHVSAWGPVETIVGDAQALEIQVRSVIQSAGKGASSATLAFVAYLPQLALQLALTLISLFFLLIDGKRLLAWLTLKIPMAPTARTQVFTTFRDTAISTIWATLAAAGVQAGLMLVAFLALGVPAASLAAGATFIFAWIPILGSFPVWTAGAIYLYVQDSPGRMIAMLAIGLGTGVADNFVRPLVLKGRGDMHPLTSLVAIFGGIHLFGILGVFVGPILMAILISLLEIFPIITRQAEAHAQARAQAQVEMAAVAAASAASAASPATPPA